jgi:hypothetical protein
MLSQGVLVRQSCQSEDRQSGTKTGNGSLKVVALRSQDTLSIDIAQRNLYARILVGGMCQRIDLQGFFASNKSRFHLLSAITIETLLVCDCQRALQGRARLLSNFRLFQFLRLSKSLPQQFYTG